MRRVQVIPSISVFVVVVLATAACTPRHPQPSPSPSLAMPSAAASSQDPRAAAVQAAYATGNALKTLTSGLQSVKGQGLKGTGAVVVAPKVTAVSPASAPTDVSLSDCMDTSGTHIVRASPGPPYSDSPGGRRLATATVQRQGDGSWKVTDFGIRGVGTC